MRTLLALILLLPLAAALVRPAAAQDVPETMPPPTAIEEVLLANSELIRQSSRRTIEPAVAAIRDSGLPDAAAVLQRWADRELVAREADGRFFLSERGPDDTVVLRHVATGEPLGTAGREEIDAIRPNAGIQRLINGALAQFRLMDPDPAVRAESLAAINRAPTPAHLPMLERAIAAEEDDELREMMERRARILSIAFAESPADRIAAIESLAGDLSLEARAAVNRLLSTERIVVRELPADANVARELVPGSDALSVEAAYELLVENGLAERRATVEERDAALAANIVDGAVGGIPVETLNTREARDEAYARLVAQGSVPPALTAEQVSSIVDEFLFVDVYAEPPEITAAALGTIGTINTSLTLNQAADLTLDAISLASIYFLAAIGLAITFGVMGVINMAHGEFIMMGAYTGYVVQLFVADRTLSLVVALPLAFAVTFLAGVALERLVIRWLYHRPLETLLATFGISIALQQIAKNIFGTQARPLTAPDWLSGSLVFNDVVQISYIRVAIFVLAAVFFLILLFILNRTRLGLEVRAVRQNPRMAQSMGIDRERVNMLTFGLGSGIAGVAGVAIGLFAQVTSELGANYIVQSFMTVVVGGVGNIFGTLAGATLIGFLQKFIEALNPGNTLAAQTYMILFIIIFIQFRPRGIVALRGRAAEA